MATMMRSKKAIAVLLCVSTVSVLFFLNSQLKTSPRRSARFETRHTLSMPLTIDLSKNVSIIQLPDANNQMHQYRLERIKEEEEEERAGGEKEGDVEEEYDYWIDKRKKVEEEQGGMAQEEQVDQPQKVLLDEGKGIPEDTDKPGEEPKVLNLNHEKERTPKPGIDPPPRASPVQADKQVKVPAFNLSKIDQIRNNYLVKFADPRYPRMIGKVLAKMPNDVRKDMTLNIRMAEAKANTDFVKLPTSRQWEIILKVFSARGYEQRFPDVINIGVKKSGTNALGFFLPQHPQIVHSIGNEVHYFDWLYSKGLDYYKSRMGFAKPNQLVFEKTPRYFVTAEAPKRIQMDLPTEPKFILLVRDPVSRLISDFRHESELKLRKEFKKERLKYSSRTGEFEGQRLRKEVLDNMGRVNASNELVDTSVYVKHFRNWLSHYPPERLHVIDQDKMEKDVYQEMKRLEEFLHLKPYFKPSMFYFDAEKRGICMRNSHIQLRNCPAKSTPSILPKAVIDRETLAKLRDFYRPFNREFAKLTGMQFSWVD